MKLKKKEKIILNNMLSDAKEWEGMYTGTDRYEEWKRRYKKMKQLVKKLCSN